MMKEARGACVLFFFLSFFTILTFNLHLLVSRLVWFSTHGQRKRLTTENDDK
jgi:hypothetical protein